MEEKFLRIKQIIGDKKTGEAPIVPVSRSTWWNWCATGRAPKPVKLGPSTTVWKLSDIQRFIEGAQA